MYCSTICSGEAMIGKPTWSKGKTGVHSKQGLVNLRLARMGTKLSEETKRKMSEACRGEKHWMWKGGVSKDRNYIKNRLRNWKQENKEILNERRKEWRRENPLKVKVMYHKRRVLTSGLNIEIVQQTYEDNIKKYGTLTCYLCLQPIAFKQDALEHKTPLSRGGSNDIENLAIAHRSCNCRKNNKTVEEYMEVCHR
jgi:5-methylcytosine-specific restriction endonuclease McrA